MSNETETKKEDKQATETLESNSKEHRRATPSTPTQKSYIKKS